MADEDERTHQSSVLREIADRISDGTAPLLSRDAWIALLREYSDAVSADSARRLRTELHRRASDVDADTATQLRAQLEARRGNKDPCDR